MKKSFVLTLLLVCSFFISKGTYAQGYTAPDAIIGLTLDGNMSVNDAYGVGNSFLTNDSYGMKYGRGVSLGLSYGLGESKANRLTVGAGFNFMINGNTGSFPFFEMNPTPPHTFYSILTGAVGYQYMFNARCKNKQFVGVELTANMIHTPAYSTITFENATRFGVRLSTGYDFALGNDMKYGITIGAKYHILNAFARENKPSTTVNNINDGTGSPGPGFNRFIGMLTIDAGFNFYTGVKPRRR
ncbi:hypothetical protein BH10BAC5_BH10BAC5_02860 [soil metagenome]